MTTHLPAKLRRRHGPAGRGPTQRAVLGISAAAFALPLESAEAGVFSASLEMDFGGGQALDMSNRHLSGGSGRWR